MAKISDFGNTWANFFAGGEAHAAHLARHPSPLHGKNWANWHRLREIFSARDSSSNVQNRAFGKPLSKIFWNCFARVSTVIDHPCESCQHHLLLAAPYCPLPFYVKIGASDTISSKFLTGWFLPRNIAFRRRHQRGTSLLFSPLKSTWRKSAILETLTDDFWKFSSSECC